MPRYVEKQLERGCGVYNLSPDKLGVPVIPGDDAEAMRTVHESQGIEAWAQEEMPHYDNVTGEALPMAMVKAARKEELTFMEDWRVWDVVPVSWCWQATGKGPLGGRWVDINKGDSERPNVRCRYVAKDIAYKKSDDYFAAMPPLEALRMLLSFAATGRKEGGGGRKVLVIDARKAHLHAVPGREIYVALPPERQQEGMCAKLRRCLYGTRDAPACWEKFLTKELIKMGFVQGKASASCFMHSTRDVRCMVHGDDFVFVGNDQDLNFIENAMAASFLIKVVGRLGGDPQDIKEISILNRIIRWTSAGLEYEADPRHAELLARDYGEGTSVTTPGTKEIIKTKGEEEEEELTPEETTWYRAGAARANYLGMDRPELAFATKELCRRMMGPRRGDLRALGRVARYLAGAVRVVYNFPWQDRGDLLVFVDTDFAGCTATRKSTSGGCAMLGRHVIKHWATTQKVVTLSSGEAELAGIVKGSAEGIGLKSLSLDLGITVDVRIFADSSAAIGICRRSGIGKVRHLATAQLWVQERIREGDIRLFKIPGTENPADLLTKNVPRDTADKHLHAMGIERRAGRAVSAPKLQSPL